MKNYIIFGLIATLASLLFFNNWQETETPNPENSIKVHGEWIITIANEQGEITDRVEFQNALTEDGAFWLSEHLSGEHTAGSWSILVTGGLCQLNDEPTDCIVAPEAEQESPSNIFQTLQISTPESGEFASGFYLEGNFTAAYDGEVTEVGTQVFQCPATTPPADCFFNEVSNLFTQKQLETPIEVQSGQAVSVNVFISFS